MEKTLTFEDLNDGDEAVVVVRRLDGGVGLTLSKRTNGDIEAFMPPVVAERLAEALREAAALG
jgi:hypothetical protein